MGSMNGIDSICAVITLVAVLVFAPLIQYVDLNSEVGYAVLKEAISEEDPDPEFICEAAHILGIEGKAEYISFEGRRNSSDRPYVYKYYDVGDRDKGGMFYFRF